jgi:hypothetical protein
MRELLMTDARVPRQDHRDEEVCCERCRQTFVAADPLDPVHFQRRDGELCGGAGVPFRRFVIRDPNRW